MTGSRNLARRRVWAWHSVRDGARVEPGRNFAALMLLSIQPQWLDRLPRLWPERKRGRREQRTSRGRSSHGHE